MSGLAAGGASVNEWTERCTWRLRSSEFGDALGGRNRVNSEMHLEAGIKLNSRMHLEAMIELGRRRIWRQRSCYSEMHLEAMIERLWGCTGRPWWSEHRDILGCRNRVSFELHLEVMMKKDWRSTWRRSMGGVPGAETVSICWLTRNFVNVMWWLSLRALMVSWIVVSIL
jgi:hypothetical protein